MMPSLSPCVESGPKSDESLRGENLLDFLELRQVISTYDGDLRDPLWWPQERPVPMRVARGLSGFLSRRCWGQSPCGDSGPEPEDSSPVLTWILGYFWSLPMESVLVSSGGLLDCAVPKLYQHCHDSHRVDQGICGFPSRLSHEAFPRGFPTRLSHKAVPRDTVVSVNSPSESRGRAGKTASSRMD